LVKNSRNTIVQDHVKGRKTEVAYLNGLVVQKGEFVGIPKPFNQAVTLMNALIEWGQLQTSPTNLLLVRDYL
jgi:2-dehydropantoate 2-reductase